MPVNPILPGGLTTDVRPVTLTSQPGAAARLRQPHHQRIPYRGRRCADRPLGVRAQCCRGGSGARRPGSRRVCHRGDLADLFRCGAARAAGQPRLFEVADLVLDNHAPIGDALIELPGLPQRAGASSTVTGAALLNAVMVRAAELLAAAHAATRRSS